MSDQNDTIAAIATAPGEGGVSIVRLSGPDSFSMADNIFRCAGPPPSKRSSHVVVFGQVADNEVVIDDAILVLMRAPKTYTREDVVEIQGHGGNTTAKRILRLVLSRGARMAEPGEFTKRAFLNGRIDLLQAEAVLDLVKAKSDRAAMAAVEQLEGGLSMQFNTLYDELIRVAADLEATLDFTENELPVNSMPEIKERLVGISGLINGLTRTWNEGHLLRDGALVVIAGKPNVGKSTLLNTLLGRDRAIVSHIPGTTRDTIEEGFVLNGIPLRLVDTAGLRSTDCEIECEGVRRSRVQMERADLQLYVVDGSIPFSSEDNRHLAGENPDKCLVVLNKMDLGLRVDLSGLSRFRVVQTSLLNKDGIEYVRKHMSAMLESAPDKHVIFPHAAISERHRQLLSDAGSKVEKALELAGSGEDESCVLASAELRYALNSIGQVTGRIYHDELLSNIFSRFCIGK